MAQTIRIVSVGKLKECYLLEGLAEYQKRLRPYCKMEIIELKDEGLEKEASSMQRFINSNTFVLDAAGVENDSLAFASFMKKQSAPITFIIGSASGVSETVKKKCRLLSLSKMTFTHDMCRLFLLEQIYRSFQINSNRPYHK